MKSAIVKGYALNEVLAHCKASDCVFARKVLRGGYQFFAWPGTKHADVARAVLSMPDEIRCVHAVFGRIGTPMDLVVDYDQPYPTVTSIESARQLRNKRLAFLVERLHRAVSDAHETVESTVVLHSPSIKKFSFHVHVRLAGKAFEDYRAVKAFVESSGIAAELPAVDTQIYRPSGMLRMFSCFKEDGTRPLQLVNDVPEIVALGANTAHVTPQVAAEHSLCIREVDAATRLIPVPASAKQPPTSAKYASDGPDIDVDTCVEEADFLTQRLTIEYSDPWKSWIAVGLCLHRIALFYRSQRPNAPDPNPRLLNAWIAFSKKAPKKFHVGVCEKRWCGFKCEDIDAANAGRALGYLRKASLRCDKEVSHQKVSAP